MVDLRNKYISQSSYDKEFTADSKFTTEKIIIPDRDYAILDILQEILLVIERKA